MGLMIVLHPKDNVATAVTPLKAGELAEVRMAGSDGAAGIATLNIVADVPLGHKVAVVAIPSDAEIIKYGEVIGRSKGAIPAGAHAHVHNVESLRGRGDLTPKEEAGK